MDSGNLGPSLSQALRYVASWKGRRVVVKYGGRALETKSMGTLMDDLVLLQKAGLEPTLVHGGGPEITRTLERLELKSRFVDGLRVTDAETLDVVEMVLAGRVNKRLVGLLQRHGGEAVGVSGRDGGLLLASPHPRADELGYVGEVESVHPRVLEVLLREGFIPVVASLGSGRDNATYNLNADTAAGALAVALGAEKLILLTDVAGIYRPASEGDDVLLPELTPSGARELVATGVISRGMIPKVEACLGAIEGGVPSAHILAADHPHGLLVELFTERGIGTLIRRPPQPRDTKEGTEVKC